MSVILGISLLLAGNVAVADSNDGVHPCSNGTAVDNPTENPSLVQDCEILLNTRDTLSGSDQLNWSPDRPISQWDGVTIGGSQPHVVDIRLDGRVISGQVPPELGSLNGLEVLSFRINSLQGRIPPELGALGKLRLLDLHGNSLKGTIPPELANLSSLEVLQLDANALDGAIPPELGKISRLKRLVLGGNDLTGSIPPELGNLSSLEWLVLSKNELSGAIPGELGNLSNLQILQFGHNRLTGAIPPQLGQLPQLFGLNLQFNELTGEIPQELANLTKLDGLILRDNQLTGEVPAWLSDLSNSSRIQLNNNRLTGAIPVELGNLRKLDLLYLHNNELTGTIPAGLATLNNITDLRLDGNKLTGNLPPAFGQLSRLEVLALSENSLTGAIPEEWGRLANLRWLSLGNNELTGPIPPLFGSLSNMEGLLLEGNELSGAIPVEIAMLSELRFLLVNDTLLTGTIPSGFTNLTRLEELDVRDTGLTGCLPWLLARNPRLSIHHDGLSICPRLSPIVREGDTLFIDISELVYGTALEDSAPISIRLGGEVNCKVWREDDTIGFMHDGSETTTASFTYFATSGTASVMQVVTVKVTPVNDPPNPATDGAVMDEGNTITLEASMLLSNDTDPEGDSLSLIAVGDARNGRVWLDGSSISYEHNGSETTTGSFSYTVSDGTDTDAATVSVAVTPVNDPPVAVTNTTVVYEGGMTVLDVSELLRNDIDPEGDSLNVTAVGDAVNGRAWLEGTAITFEHDGSETTEASYTYTVSDGSTSDTAQVVVVVTPVNDPPAPADDNVSVDEGGTVTLDVSDLLRNDIDPDSESLSIETVGDALNGKVRLEGSTVTFEHDGSETTRGSFTYTLTDGTASNEAQVVVAVTAVNDPPVAAADTLTVVEGGTVTLDVSELLRNDADSDNSAIVLTAVGDARNGIVQLDGMTISFEHDGSETTQASFMYTVSDGMDTDTTSVVLAVTQVNDSPTAVADTATVAEGDTLSMETSTLLDNDTDAENDMLSIVAVGNPVNGRVFLDGTTITYSHDGTETDRGGFSYTVSDGKDTTTTTVAITVVPEGVAPATADERIPVTTATSEVEATGSPIPGSDITPATSPPTTPEASVPPTDDGGMNVGLVVLIIVLAVVVASGGVVVLVRSRNRT